MSSKAAQGSVSAEVCRAALQGVEGALPCVSPARQAALLAAVTSLSSRAAARSALKAACLDFQLALLAKGRAVLYPNPGTGLPQLPGAVLVRWLQVSSVCEPQLAWVQVTVLAQCEKGNMGLERRVRALSTLTWERLKVARGTEACTQGSMYVAVSPVIVQDCYV